MAKKIFIKYNYLIIEDTITGSTIEIPCKDSRYDDRGNVFSIYNIDKTLEQTVLFSDIVDISGVAYASQAVFLDYLRANTGSELNFENSEISGNAQVITPSDVTVFSNPVKLYVGVGGNVKVQMLGGAEVTFTNVPSGTFLRIKVIKVFLTGTTATTMLGLW